MPYSMKKGKGDKPFKIVNKETGKTVGSSTSAAKAKASMRARYAAEGGYTMRNKGGSK